MKKWFVRIGLVSILTISIVSPASAAGEVNPEWCRDANCWIQY